MLTKNDIKFIQSLQTNKVRREEQLFVSEGNKIVGELLQTDFKVQTLCATEDWKEHNKDFNYNGYVPETVSEKQMEQMSSLSTAPGLLAVARIPFYDIKPEEAQQKLIIVLDDIHDPGNLGTIIRTAEWFGFGDIVCSRNTVDAWSPKVVQATMGSILRCHIIHTDIITFIQNSKAPVFGALMEGNNIYNEMLSKNGIIVIGSESHGIKADIMPYINHAIHIPCSKQSKADSLNASIATAIILSEFYRH